MSTYHQYKFVSPIPIYARIKEEMRSYFDTGAVDDLLFPLWTDDCLKRFQKTYLKIKPEVLLIEDYTAKLPEDFDGVREAWMCTEVEGRPILLPNSYYYQKDFNISNFSDSCNILENIHIPGQILATHKVTTEVVNSFNLQYLLKPGNDNALSWCRHNCANIHSNSADTFDIRDCKMIVNFRSGIVYLTYYAKEYDDSGYQLVPDNWYIQDYIQKYIKYKIYSQLCDQATDETYKIIKDKRQDAERASVEAYLMASVDSKQETTNDKQRAIKRSYKRNDRFNIN